MQIRSAVKSIWFFSQLFFVKKKYDVVFIYRNSFIRRGGTNYLLKPFVESCKTHGLRYLLLESRHLQRGTGYKFLSSSDAVPYNLVSFFQGKLRRYFSKPGTLYSSTPQWIEREESVAKILKKLFFRNLDAKLFVTLVGNENMAFLKFIYPDSLFAEYQHGISWCQDDPAMLKVHHFQREYLNKNTSLLLYGEGFAKVRRHCPDAVAFPNTKLRVIGAYFPIPQYAQKQNNKTILYTLQNVDMESNTDYYRIIRKLITDNADFLEKNGYKILFKNHPRYRRDDALHFEKEYPFIHFVGDSEPMALLSDISIHITSKSTTALDAALYGVPTIFIDMLEIRSPKKIFFDLYRYPLSDFRVEQSGDLMQLLKSLEGKENYREYSKKVYVWGREYYQDFDEQVFLDMINQSQQERHINEKSR